MYDRLPPRGPASFPVGGPGSAPPDADRVDVRDLVGKIWRRKWLIFWVTVMSCVIAAAIVLRITPLYQSTSKVMLNPQQVRINTSRDVVSAVDVSTQIVNSEVKVLTSNVLIEKVIGEIGFDRLAPIDRDGGSLPFEAEIKALLGLPGPPPVSGAAARDRRIERMVSAIRKVTSVQADARSFVISIRVTTPDPELSARIAGALTRQYIANQLADRKASASQAAAWIEQRLAVLKSDLAGAEAAVDAYRATSLVVDGASLATASQQLVELNSQLALARAEHTSLKAAFEQLAAVAAQNGPGEAAALVASPVLDTLDQQMADLKYRDSVWAESYGADNPVRKKLAGQIAQLKTAIAGEVEKQIAARRSKVESARATAAALDAGIKDMEKQIIRMSSNAIGLRDLQNRASAARTDYQDMLSRLSETRSQEQLQRPDAQVIERATIPGAPVSPRPKLITATAGLLGLALGVGLAFFLELSVTKYRAATELEQDTGLRVLAAIPRGNWRSMLAAYRDLERHPRGVFAERIRHLRTAVFSLTDRRPDGGGKSIVLTSSIPMEGKSTTTLALAKMASLAGKSVVVIDCDLRRSSMQRVFRWDMAHDLGDFIANKCPLGAAIHTDTRLGFDVMAAARPVPEAADDLSASWLEPMLATLKQHYDLILLDTPPILAVSDALVLSQVVDHTLYLVRANGAARKAVAKGLASMEEIGLAPAGAVLTMAEPDREPVYGREYALHG